MKTIEDALNFFNEEIAGDFQTMNGSRMIPKINIEGRCTYCYHWKEDHRSTLLECFECDCVAFNKSKK